MSASTDSNMARMGVAAANDAPRAATPQAAGVSGGAAPAISVVIVADSDLDRLDCNLDALLRQDLTLDYELLIVDSDADPAAARLVKAWTTRSAGHHAILRYLPGAGPRRGLAAARNLGWQAAAAPFIAFTDADTVPACDWLRHGLAAFESELETDVPAGSADCTSTDPGPAPAAPAALVDAVFGRVDARLPKHPTEYQLDTCLRDAGDFSPRNWFCRRATLVRLGGFDERFGALPGEADDLHLQLLESNACVRLAPQAVVSHPVLPDNWGASLSHLRQIGTEFLLRKKHPRAYREQTRRDSKRRACLPLWHDLTVVTLLLLAALGLWLHHEVLTVAAGGSWMVLTGMLIIRRLLDTAKTPGHIAEVVLTSLVLPPLAVFWRLVGALQYRLHFASP